jgi:hypothetical protein
MRRGRGVSSVCRYLNRPDSYNKHLEVVVDQALQIELLKRATLCTTHAGLHLLGLFHFGVAA